MTNLSPHLESMTVLDDLNFERVEECKDSSSRVGHSSLRYDSASESIGHASNVAGLNPAALTNFASGNVTVQCVEARGIDGVESKPSSQKPEAHCELTTGLPLAELSPNESQKDQSNEVSYVAPTGRTDSPIMNTRAIETVGGELDSGRVSETEPCAPEISPQPPGQSERRAVGGCPPRFFMFCECSYCELNYNYKPCGPEDHLRKTHGICPACAEIEKSKIECLRISLFSLNTQQSLDPISVG